MADPLTALMYAVQVMNFLKTLVLKTLKERKDSVIEPSPARRLEPSDENGHQSPSQPCMENNIQDNDEMEQVLIGEEPVLGSSLDANQTNNLNKEEAESFMSSVEKLNLDGDGSCETSAQVDTSINKAEAGQVNTVIAGVEGNIGKSKTRGMSNLSRIDSRIELIEAWR